MAQVTQALENPVSVITDDLEKTYSCNNDIIVCSHYKTPSSKPSVYEDFCPIAVSRLTPGNGVFCNHDKTTFRLINKDDSVKMIISKSSCKYVIRLCNVTYTDIIKLSVYVSSKIKASINKSVFILCNHTMTYMTEVEFNKESMTHSIITTYDNNKAQFEYHRATLIRGPHLQCINILYNYCNDKEIDIKLGLIDKTFLTHKNAKAKIVTINTLSLLVVLYSENNEFNLIKIIKALDTMLSLYNSTNNLLGEINDQLVVYFEVNDSSKLRVSLVCDYSHMDLVFLNKQPVIKIKRGLFNAYMALRDYIKLRNY